MGLWSYIAPEGTTNHVLNPSSEIAGNFAAVGGGTMTSITTSSFFGLRSYRIQTVANNEGGSVDLNALANAIHYVTMRVRGTLPTSWDWSLDNAAYTAPAELLDYDGDWSLYGLQFPAAQANGATTLYFRQNGAGAGDFNVDAIQVEEQTSWTTYCDGDRAGCEWLGVAHGSQSQRSALSRSGGTVTDFADLDFDVTGFVGTGKAPITLNVDNYALLPGGELNSQKTNVNRQALIDAVSINQTPENQPVILRYTGASVVKEIEAYYQTGLGGNIRAQFECLEQSFALRFLATSPNFTEVGESADILDTNDSATLRYLSARFRSTGQWDDTGLTNDPAGGVPIYPLVIFIASDKSVYIGGGFTSFNNVAGRDYVARYIPSTDTWETIGGASDINADVYDITEGPDGTIYMSGEFTNAGGVAAADYIASWDGNNWAAVGTPNAGGAAINNIPALLYARDGNLYAGGDYDNLAGIAAADNIAYWDGANWNAMGTGLNASVGTHGVVENSAGTIFAIGSFQNAGGDANADFFAQFISGAADWTSVGDTAMPNNVDALEADLDGQTIYIGSQSVDMAGIADADYVVGWNGTAYFALSANGVNAAVDEIVAVDVGDILLLGPFTQAGDRLVDGVVRWTRGIWAHIDFNSPTGSSMISAAVGNLDPVVSVNRDWWLGFSASGAGNFAGSVVATNDGTQDAYPLIVISRNGGTTATIKTLRNESIGLDLLFDYDLLDGETLTIDLSPQSKNITSNIFGQRLDAILPNSDFGTWRLQPGDNQVTCFVDVTGAPTIEGSIIFSDQYWSMD
jgi:hypothetical protein